MPAAAPVLRRCSSRPVSPTCLLVAIRSSPRRGGYAGAYQELLAPPSVVGAASPAVRGTARPACPRRSVTPLSARLAEVAVRRSTSRTDHRSVLPRPRPLGRTGSTAQEPGRLSVFFRCPRLRVRPGPAGRKPAAARLLRRAQRVKLAPIPGGWRCLLRRRGRPRSRPRRRVDSGSRGRVS